MALALAPRFLSRVAREKQVSDDARGRHADVELIDEEDGAVGLGRPRAGKDTTTCLGAYSRASVADANALHCFMNSEHAQRACTRSKTMEQAVSLR